MKDDQLGDSHRCTECNSVFWVVWQNDGMIKTITFCPFCGERAEKEPEEEDKT